MLRILESRSFPVDELVPLASAEIRGANDPVRRRDVEIRERHPDALRGADLSLSAAGATVARRSSVRRPPRAPSASTSRPGCGWSRTCPSHPRGESRALGSPRIVAVPNCTTIVAMMALAPLHRAAGLRSIVLSSYQAVSGAGRDGTRELAEQHRSCTTRSRSSGARRRRAARR